MTLHISASHAAVATMLLDDTALGNCTAYDYDALGITVRPLRPPSSFSDGQKALWIALTHYAKTGVIPAVDETHLDTGNRLVLNMARQVALALGGVR